MNKQVLAGSLFTLSVSLFGCGGGGGSSNSQPADTLVINSENAPKIAAIVVAADFTGGLENGIDDASDFAAIPVQKKYFEALDDGLYERNTTGGGLSVSCEHNGTVTMDMTSISNDGGVSTTFSGTFAFDNCSDDGDFTLNGALSTAGDSYDHGSRSNSNTSGSVSLRDHYTGKSVTIGDIKMAMNIEYGEYNYSQSYYVSGSMIDNKRFSVMTRQQVSGVVDHAPTAGLLQVNGAEGSGFTIEFDSVGDGVWIDHSGGRGTYYSYVELKELAGD
ncbi:hypothetical protein [Hahella sp. HN01]|uniref:hypothetical protein n=1 Tax=Hahella sp. HN01 TaxID=2847262 RepID=UPI001C1EEFA1|nr:hypothetical protein [Hahella sp. HN01]MBU6952107.1 hypothetical protein [Hahella sp. HN01]